MAQSFLGNLISGGAKGPADMNDPTYTSPEAIKNRMSLSNQLLGQTQFAPHWTGALSGLLTGIHGGLERNAAETALTQNTAMQNKAAQAAAAAPDNLSAAKALAMGGVPDLAMKGVEGMMSDRDQAEKRKIEMHKAESERIKADAMMKGVAKYHPNPVTGELYSSETGAPPPGTAAADPDAARRAMMAKNYFGAGGYKDDVKEATQTNKDARDQLSTLRQMEALLAGGKVMTGTLTPEGLAMRKAFASVLPAGWVDSKKISDTEVFQFLTQKGIFDFVKQLKPASNTDFINAERASLSVRTDPNTLPVYMPMLKNYALRSEMASRLRLNMIKNGRMPDDELIEREVNRAIPLYVPEQLRIESTPASGPTVQGKNQARLPPGGAPAPADEAGQPAAPAAAVQASPPAAAPQVNFSSMAPDRQRAAALRLKQNLGGPNEEAELRMFREAYGDDALARVMGIIKGANFQPAAR